MGDETDITTLHSLGCDNNQISPRERNTVIFELDRAAVRSYIETNQPEKLTEKILSSFTVPQIVDFVDYATALDRAECVAILVSFRTTHFSDFNYLDLFVLEL